MKTTLILLSTFFASTMMLAQKKSVQSNNHTQTKNEAFTNENEKKQWILENPEKYKESGGQILEKKPKEIKTEATVQTEDRLSNTIINIPAEPEFINTGHPKSDHVNYSKRMKEWTQKMEAINKYNGVFNQSSQEKEVWIKANPKLYNPNN